MTCFEWLVCQVEQPLIHPLGECSVSARRCHRAARIECLPSCQPEL